MKKYFLEIVVFICGAVVMVFEIVGSRVLGPYLGTSIFIWTSLIGIILGSLSLGYWLGGKMADRIPSYKRLAWIILFSGILIYLTNTGKDFVLNYLSRVIGGLRGQSVLSALLLFAPASVFLGMVSPYAVRLKMKDIKTSGRTVGNLYAVSTIGSIAGTFLAGFFLIPLMRTTNVLYLLAGLQVFLSIVLFMIDQLGKRTVLPALLLLLTVYSALAYNLKDKAFIDIDTAYNRVWIYDVDDMASGRTLRYMRINNESSSAMYLDSDSLVFPYAKFYSLADHFTPGFSTTLMLGGAAFSYPKYFLQRYAVPSMDVVEIDPRLTSLARQYFRLQDDPRLSIYHEDARTFVNSYKKKYDVIYGDLFRSQYTLPWQLTTLEAIQQYDRILNKGGCMLVNIISSIQGPGSEFLAAEVATFRKVFPQVHVYAVQDPEDMDGIQSIMLAAVKSNKPYVTYSISDSTFSSHEVTDLIMGNGTILTDDHAPVDFIMGKAIR